MAVEAEKEGLDPCSKHQAGVAAGGSAAGEGGDYRLMIDVRVCSFNSVAKRSADSFSKRLVPVPIVPVTVDFQWIAYVFIRLRLAAEGFNV